MSRPPRRPAPPRHTVAVEIAGEKHVLRSDVPPEYTRAVAAHVDATIRALPGFQTLEPFRAATLAALSITDELFRAREEIRRLREDAGYRTGILAGQLETAVAAAAEQRPIRRPAAAPPSASWTTDAANAPQSATRAAPPATPPPLPPSPAPPSAEARAGVDQPAVAAPPLRAAESGPGPPPLPGSEPAWQEDASPAPTPREASPGDDPELEFPPPE